MSSYENVDTAVGQAHEHTFAHIALVPARQHGDAHRQAGQHARQVVVMLARQYFRRCEQCGLHSGFDRNQHRVERNQRLSRAHVALQQAQHRCCLPHVALDLGDGAPLCACKRVGEPKRIAQATVAEQCPPLPPPRRRAHEHQRQLVGEDFVICQSITYGGVVGNTVRSGERASPIGPVPSCQQSRLDPFGHVAATLQRLLGKLRHLPGGQSFRQRVDHLPHRECFVGREYMIGMNDLTFLAVKLELARNELRLVQRQQLLGIPGRAAEVDQADIVALHVDGVNAQRTTRSPLLVLHGGDDDADLLSGQRIVEPRDMVPRHGPSGQMKQHIDDAGQSKARQWLCQRATDTFERFDFGKQRIEEFGSHG